MKGSQKRNLNHFHIGVATFSQSPPPHPKKNESSVSIDKGTYLLEGPSPTRYSTTLSMYPLSLGMIGRGRGGPPRPITPGGIPVK